MIKLLNYFLFLFGWPRYSYVQLFLRRTLVLYTFMQHYRPGLKALSPKKTTHLLFLLFMLLSPPIFAQANLAIKFLHIANGKPIVQNDSIYHNASGEPYSISKLKYYVSNISVAKTGVFLINAFEQDSIGVKVTAGRYDSLSFLLGVDSLHNSSGAQDGALDPLNDMFWTWNSGYVTFKLEGNSDSSPADLKRVEHHIGGYKGAYKTMRMIRLKLPQPLNFKNKEQHNIVITMNIDKYWNGASNISIRENPVVVIAGALAVRSADNLQQMFSVKYAE